MASGITRFLKHSGIYALGNVLNRVGALILLPMFTSYLSVTQYGQLEILYSTTAVLRTVFGAGLAHTTLRFFYEEKDPTMRGRVVSTTYITGLVLISIGALIGWACSGPIATELLADSRLIAAVHLTLLIMVLELTSEICLAYCRVREWSLFFVAISFVKLVVQVTAGVLFVAVAHRGVEGVMLSNLCCVGFTWAILTLVVLRSCGLWFEAHRLPAMLRYSMPLALSGLIGVAGANADRFVLRTLVSVEAVGIYGLGMKFCEILRFGIIEPFQRGYGPFRFSIMQKEDAKDIQRRVVAILLAGSGLAALALAAAAPLAIRLMSPPAYWQASQVTAIALIGTVAAGIGYCFETGILIRRQTGRFVWISAASLVLATVLQVVLARSFGIVGAAAASALTQIGIAALTCLLANQLYPLKYFTEPQYLVALATVALLALLAWSGPQSVLWQLLLWVLVTATFAALVLGSDREVRGYLVQAAASD
jgi:O-antigen/teichoic acid export membrane protein